ncbi:MAG TPA: hypothetical protein VFG49_13475 [Dyella sp.]|uniref:hypothetical protein n=1 Tax=Dyella sp. TaxID=1869338 RepID=UPI002D77A40A|nr:hypothetical protein [Dyella sp.]HET6554531.1 hypothetical protein [Dyella sp.]
MNNSPFSPVRLASATVLGSVIALAAYAAPQKPDFTGAWRLDDRNSDTTDTLTTAMRNEARQEQQAAMVQGPAPASSSAGAAPGGHGNGGGRHGGGAMGGGAGGMGGGGMGHGGGMGGGGHGHHGNGDNTGGKAAVSDKDPIATATYPMPPMFKLDSVLLVQQDDQAFQVRLNDGSQMTGKLDGQARQSLSGNAMVRGHIDNGQLHVSVQYADGMELEQTWALSPDGQQMIVTGAWKVPALQQAVTFKRTYIGLH